MRADELFQPAADFPLAAILEPSAAPWTWLAAMRRHLDSLDWDLYPARNDIPPGLHISGSVFIHPTVKLPSYGEINGPCWIGEGCELRAGIYLRGYVIAGRHCVLGHACEIKNALLFDYVQVPHFNYVGDSILGNKAHLGAGVVLANLRFDHAPVNVLTATGKVDTGLVKLGAMLGDGAEVGCNAVLQPGTVLGQRAVVSGGMVFSGTLEPGMLLAPTMTTLRKIQRPD